MLVGACLGVLALSPGCTAGGDEPQVVPPQGVPGVDATITFEHEGTLKMAPGETVEVAVVGKPGKPYAIKFLLVGDSLDASLDRTDVVADAAGRATVRLRAPNSATYFALRATVKDGPSANLNVAVSDQGFGTLTLNPEYSGKRSVEEWTASVVAGTTCQALASTFPNDPEGPPPVTALPGEPLVIEDVPVGPNLAVFVRSGHYMWGCADESDLVAGENVDLKVRIKDKPLDLQGAELSIVLSMAPDEGAWSNLVVAQRAALIDAFFGRDTPAEMLLAAMGGVYAGDPQEFATASLVNDWLLAIDEHLALGGVDLAVDLATFVDEGLLVEPREVVANLVGVDSAPEHAVLTLVRLGTATPAVMNVPGEYVVSFTADPDDTVRMGGTLFWMPSRYFGHVAAQHALDQYDQASDFTDVLAELTGCSTLELSGLDDCDQECVTELCVAALAARWSAALGSSAQTLVWGELPFESSGGARFDDHATVTGYSGSWLGKLVAGDKTVNVTGSVQANDLSGQPPAE